MSIHDAPTVPLAAGTLDPVGDAVHAYALAVRDRLADLTDEQVDELAGGLEADLAEALADASRAMSDAETRLGPDLTEVFGPVEEYAAELRVAAGFTPVAPAAAPQRTGVRASIRAAAQDAAAQFEPISGSRQWAATADFLRAIRPAWWVLRAWAAFLVMEWILRGTTKYVPETFFERLGFVLLVVVSVQWARGRWQVARIPRWLRRIATIGLVLVAVGCVDHMAHELEGGTTRTVYESTGAGPGVYSDGELVENLFVYDAAGNPVDGAQVFDERGQPVAAQSEETTWDSTQIRGLGGGWYYAPSATDDGREVWNAYPLRIFGENDAISDDDDFGMVPDSPEAMRDAPRPFEMVAPLATGPATSATPAPTGPESTP